MAYNEVNTDAYGVIFHISPHITYTIGWWQIDKDGIDYWHNHLKEKSWFSDEMSRRLKELYQDRVLANYYL